MARIAWESKKNDSVPMMGERRILIYKGQFLADFGNAGMK
jgi:hypothetical protein